MNYAKKLKHIRVSRKWSQDKMGQELGISQQVYANMENNTTQRLKPEIIDWVEKNYVDVQEEIVSNAAKSNEISLAALLNLTEANKEMAESNNKLSDGHLRLITILEKSTAGVCSNTFLASSAKSADLLEVMIDVAMGKRWRSREEAFEELDTRFDGVLSKKQGGDISDD